MTAQGRGGGGTPKRLVELLNKVVFESSQSEVARKTGLTQSAIGRYIRGIGEPSQATLQKLANYFEVHVAWLQGVPWIGKDGNIDFNDSGPQIATQSILCGKCGKELTETVERDEEGFIIEQVGIIKVLPCENCCKGKPL